MLPAWLFRGLFPIECLICRQEGKWLCHHHDDLPPAPPSQVKYQYLDEIFAATAYQHLSVKKIIEYLKFRGFRSLTQIMALPMYHLIPSGVWQKSVIVPIPLHWRRQLWRGFNQSQCLATQLQKINPDIEINISLLKRKKYTQQQARLNRFDRQRNLVQAFSVQSDKLPPRTVILIDDVVASGHTLEAAAQVLKAAGVQRVIAVVFARGGDFSRNI